MLEVERSKSRRSIEKISRLELFKKESKIYAEALTQISYILTKLCLLNKCLIRAQKEKDFTSADKINLEYKFLMSKFEDYTDHLNLDEAHRDILITSALNNETQMFKIYPKKVFQAAIRQGMVPGKSDELQAFVKAE